MLRIAVCDDEQEFLNVFSSYIKQFIENNEEPISVQAYLSASQFLEKHEKSEFDIVFLDIEMPTLGGFQCVERLRKFNEDVIIIFVSNYENYVFESFLFRPFRFIRKNHLDDELEEALKSSSKLYYERNRLYNISSEVGMVSVKLADIIYFDVYSHRVFIHTGNKNLLIKKSLQDVENDLSDLGFIRVHKSYLVNVRYIYSIKSNSIALVNKENIPMSKHRAKEVKEKMIYYSKRMEG